MLTKAFITLGDLGEIRTAQFGLTRADTPCATSVTILQLKGPARRSWLQVFYPAAHAEESGPMREYGATLFGEGANSRRLFWLSFWSERGAEGYREPGDIVDWFRLLDRSVDDMLAETKFGPAGTHLNRVALATGIAQPQWRTAAERLLLTTHGLQAPHA